jgi:hypothetical protein
MAGELAVLKASVQQARFGWRAFSSHSNLGYEISPGLAARLFLAARTVRFPVFPAMTGGIIGPQKSQRFPGREQLIAELFTAERDYCN